MGPSALRDALFGTRSHTEVRPATIHRLPAAGDCDFNLNTLNCLLACSRLECCRARSTRSRARSPCASSPRPSSVRGACAQADSRASVAVQSMTCLETWSPILPVRCPPPPPNPSQRAHIPVVAGHGHHVGHHLNRHRRLLGGGRRRQAQGRHQPGGGHGRLGAGFGLAACTGRLRVTSCAVRWSKLHLPLLRLAEGPRGCPPATAHLQGAAPHISDKMGSLFPLASWRRARWS